MQDATSAPASCMESKRMGIKKVMADNTIIPGAALLLSTCL